MNKVIGILTGVVFVSIFSGNTGWFPEFFQLKSIVESVSSLYIRSKALTGIYVCYVTAAASVYFIVFPHHAMRMLSPKISSSNQSVLTEGAWVIIGYLFVGLTFGILHVYKHSI